jgi:hypothetical protein
MGAKVAEFLNVFFGFRKTIVMLLLVLIGIVFRLENFINGSEFVDLLKNTVIAFFASNSIEHFTSMAKSYMDSKGQKETEQVVDLDQEKEG